MIGTKFSRREILSLALGININLWWGLVMLVFGIVMLLFGRRGARAKQDR